MTLVPLALALLLSAPPASTPPPVEDRIDLNLKDADIRDVALHLAAFAGLSAAIGPEVRGTVTISLKDVAPEQALALILRIHGYGTLKDGRVIRVGSFQSLTFQAQTYR